MFVCILATTQTLLMLSRTKKMNFWLRFVVSYSALSTCKELYAQENPSALKNRCKLNHFQTSEAEICCCAQWMKNSVGDSNWMFLENRKSWITRGTQNTFPFAFFSAPKMYWKHFLAYHVLTYNSAHVLWLGLSWSGICHDFVQTCGGTHWMPNFIGWKDVPNKFLIRHLIISTVKPSKGVFVV